MAIVDSGKFSCEFSLFSAVALFPACCPLCTISFYLCIYLFPILLCHALCFIVLLRSILCYRMSLILCSTVFSLYGICFCNFCVCFAFFCLFGGGTTFPLHTVVLSSVTNSSSLSACHPTHPMPYNTVQHNTLHPIQPPHSLPHFLPVIYPSLVLPPRSSIITLPFSSLSPGSLFLLPDRSVSLLFHHVISLTFPLVFPRITTPHVLSLLACRLELSALPGSLIISFWLNFLNSSFFHNHVFFIIISFLPRVPFFTSLLMPSIVSRSLIYFYSPFIYKYFTWWSQTIPRFSSSSSFILPIFLIFPSTSFL